MDRVASYPSYSAIMIKETNLTFFIIPGTDTLYFHPHSYLYWVLLCKKGYLRFTPCNHG